MLYLIRDFIAAIDMQKNDSNTYETKYNNFIQMLN